ncbi:uncharacterized protein LOC143659888 [Tamandua tetradactyla]|uniref:uncharacterized protein LOC143659888 n=1 Tax=Tamandua tetradactyla TaxID=48850 RepID=UPI0040548C17
MLKECHFLQAAATAKTLPRGALLGAPGGAATRPWGRAPWLPMVFKAPRAVCPPGRLTERRGQQEQSNHTPAHTGPDASRTKRKTSAFHIGARQKLPPALAWPGWVQTF